MNFLGQLGHSCLAIFQICVGKNLVGNRIQRALHIYTFSGLDQIIALI